MLNFILINGIMTLNEPSAVVVIPSVLSDDLAFALASVKLQTYKNVHAHVFVDGKQHMKNYKEAEGVKYTILDENVGKANGKFYYGHRVYAACPHLVNADYVFFLDEDNQFESTHVESLIELCERRNLDFAFSHRYVFKADPIEDDGECVRDSCESLGIAPIFGREGNPYLVDTSSYCFRREFLIPNSHFWHSGWGGDRRFFGIMRGNHHYVNTNYEIRKPRYGTTGKPTLLYKTGNNPNSVSLKFFKEGNEEAKKNMPDRYPFDKEEVVI